MKEIRKVFVCDICKKDFTPSRIKWISNGCRLRFYKRDRLGWPGDFKEYDVCAKCFQQMFDWCKYGPTKPDPTKAPPLGVIPQFIHDERRARDLIDAIVRYLDADRGIPSKWLDELTSTIKRLHPEREDQ